MNTEASQTQEVSKSLLVTRGFSYVGSRASGKLTKSKNASILKIGVINVHAGAKRRAKAIII